MLNSSFNREENFKSLLFLAHASSPRNIAMAYFDLYGDNLS